MKSLFWGAVIALITVGPSFAQTVLSGPLAPYSRPLQGTAEDLDSILVDGYRIRLTNIDNLELSDADARRALQIIEEQLFGQPTTCDLSVATGDRYEGTCRMGDVDVGDWFVAAGFAVYLP